LSALGKKNELLPFFEEEGDRILSHLQKNETERTDQILKARFGAGFSLKELGVTRKTVI
jgi:hypothetical protein